jgi:phenylalanyl-tRNA synthetase alpha chain
MNNISKSINEKRLLKLHNNPNHPICQLKEKIQLYFYDFDKFDHLSEVVSIQDNFDDLLIPAHHPARSLNDTYYVDDEHVLRTHTSAHQNRLLRQGYTKFIATGDVYRKDTIDKTHYPVFHQMEGVKIVQEGTDPLIDLKITLEGLIHYLYPGKEYRFLDDYFPFTNPSLQIEVLQETEWMEVLGAGVIEPKILKNCGINGTGWAFGLGIDRLLLSYCNIPDIRYLWTSDPRFISQFKNGLTIFKEYSKYPPVLKDVSFWVNNYHETGEQMWNQHNNFCEIIREVGRDLIESVSLIDKFHRKGKTSLAYRIIYRSNDRTLVNSEINEIQENIRKEIEETFDIELR